MGITVESENRSIDLGYGGFSNLRTKVAELTGKEIGEHYKKLRDGIFLVGEKRKNFFVEYDKKIAGLEKQFEIPGGILDFLYASDCSAEIPVGACKQIYEVIKDYDDDVLYGYIGRTDCAKFNDFKELVKDCIDSNCSMEWF